MKKITITVLLAAVAMVSMAQGIRFEENLNWYQIMGKAKKENKYIFVDMMATWCMPCEVLETKVFPDENLGSFANEHFVSVRVQADKTKSDSQQVKNWYSDAELFGTKFRVSAFPTFLFFSPEGQIVHRAVGAKNANELQGIMANAMNENGQYYGRYYRLLTAYEKGNKNYPEMPAMVTMAKGFKEVDIANRIADDYIHNYLLKLPKEQLYSKENINFLVPYVSSKDKAVFSIFFPNGERADSLIRGISKRVLSEVILREEINAKILVDNNYSKPKVENPDWKKLARAIRRKYGADGGPEINKAQRQWYKTSKPDGNALARATVRYFQLYAPVSKINNYMTIAVGVNDVLYQDVASKGTEKEVLLMACDIQLEAMERYRELRKKAGKIVWIMASQLDTYACLLYKAGKIDEAKKWMQKALAESPYDEELRDHREQMIAGKILVLK